MVTVDPRRWWALAALVASMLVLGFDITILNVALPSMAADLSAGTGEQQWMVDAYVVVFAALMLPGGMLGDRYGRRAMLIVGLALFMAGSVVGALVHTVELVIVARLVMGCGAALVTPLALAVIPTLFGPAERSKAVGAVTAATALGLPLGPITGGWLLDHFWWGSVFLINVPMAALSITACVFLLPESHDPAAPRIDTGSVALTGCGLGALVYAIIEAPTHGVRDPLVPAAAAAAVLLLAALVRHERRAARPMLDVTLLHNRGFLLNSLAATLVMFVLSGLIFLLTPYLQTVLRHDALGTGTRLLPLMAGLVVAARGATVLVQRCGARAVISAGLVVLASAAFLGSRTTTGSGYGFTALWLSVVGLGVGCTVVPAMDAALGTLPADRSGSGSGLMMTLRQMGSALGVAVLGSLLSGAFRDRLDVTGLPARAADAAGDSVVAAHLVAARTGTPRLAASADAAFVHGMDRTLLTCGAVALLTALLAAVLLPGGTDTKATGSGTGVAPRPGAGTEPRPGAGTGSRSGAGAGSGAGDGAGTGGGTGGGTGVTRALDDGRQ